MVAPKKTPAAAKSTEAEVAAAIEAPVQELKYSDLSPELQAIFDEAEKIKEVADAEARIKSAKITAFLLAGFKTARETGKNADAIMAKIEEVAKIDEKGVKDTTITEISETFYQVVLAVAGKHLAADFLKTLDGDKTAFISIMKDVIRLASVVKA